MRPSWYFHEISSGCGTVTAAQLMWTFWPTTPDCAGEEDIFGGPEMLFILSKISFVTFLVEGGIVQGRSRIHFLIIYVLPVIRTSAGRDVIVL